MSPVSVTSTNDHESSEEEESWTDAKDEQYKDRMVADDKAGFSKGNVYNGKTCKTFLLTVGFKIFDCENSPAVYEMSMITDFSVCAHFWRSLGKDVFTSDQMRRNIYLIELSKYTKPLYTVDGYFQKQRIKISTKVSSINVLFLGNVFISH